MMIDFAAHVFYRLFYEPGLFELALNENVFAVI